MMEAMKLYSRALHARRILPALTALVLATACVDDPAPVAPITDTGRVAGILFFDRDNNNVFTPTAGDSAMGGVTVRLLARGTNTELASATTGVDGRYSIDVPVGTHDLDVVRSSDIIASRFVWCGARPSVYSNEETFVPTPLKFGCVVRINVAKNNPPATTVTIAGVVTAQPGRFRNDNLYLQDVSGGIQVFGVSFSLGLLEGDTIEVTGELGAFNDQLQIVSPRIASNIKRGGAPAVPINISTAQAAAASSPLSSNLGRLVKVRAVAVGTFSGANAPINDGSGAAVLRLDGQANGNIGTSTFQANTCYDITGILGFFRGASQLLPRSSQDVTEVSCS